MTVWINRRTGVMHRKRSCAALEHVHPRALRPERFDPNRPRRRCSRCWTSVHPLDRLRGDFPLPT